MDRFKKYFIKPWNAAAMDSQGVIPHFIWNHLRKVYCTLVSCLVSALFGAYSHMFFEIGGWTTALGFIGSLYWMSKINPWREKRRVMIFMLASYFFGSTITPAINLIGKVDQGYIIKIIMGAIVFFTCQLSAAIHSHHRFVIYQIGEFSTPIFISAWMIINESYPGFLALAFFLLFLPFPWYLVTFLLKHIRYTLHLWLNFPVHLAWIALLSYCFKYPFPDLLRVYLVIWALVTHMRMFFQEAIYLAAQNTDEAYYVNTAITFYTEFLARTTPVCMQSVYAAKWVVREVTRNVRLVDVLNDAYDFLIRYL